MKWHWYYKKFDILYRIYRKSEKKNPMFFVLVRRKRWRMVKFYKKKQIFAKEKEDIKDKPKITKIMTLDQQ